MGVATIGFVHAMYVVTSEEYQLLLRLNQMTIAKYSDMTALAGRLNQVSQQLNEKCKQLCVHTKTSCDGRHTSFPCSPVSAALL